jgi:hypothetical protein
MERDTLRLGDGPTRKLHCPVCASDIEKDGRGFSCVRGAGLENRLGYAIRRAVYGVDPSKEAPRKAPEMADWFWCPNCTAAMDDSDERGRECRCPTCGLSLPAVELVGMMEFKDGHTPPEGWW